MGRRAQPARWALFAAVGASWAAPGSAQGPSACTGLSPLLHVGQLQPCIDEVLPAATAEQSKLMRKAVGTLAESRDACTASIDKATEWGCKALSDLGYEIFAQALTLLHICLTRPSGQCDDQGRAAAMAQLNVWQATEIRFANTAAEKFVTGRLTALREEVLLPLVQGDRLGEGAEALPPSWQAATKAVDKLKHWVSGYIWRETHWLWLQDSLQAGRVVQTTWGTAEEWLRFGVHDAHADSPLDGAPPLYTFNERLGMRWEILVALLKELHQRRGAWEQLIVVEVGVFAGHLSNFLLRDCSFIRLLGVDPYIGADGTFPGNFSETLDSNVALYKAASVIEPYGDRAELWPMTSEAAAAQVEDGVVDAIFIDGCHLYDCVKSDFELWMPKMRRGHEVLVAGHDFSPQWPGVVRAVHERRAGGQEVNLATDWMWWWFEQRP